MKSRISLLSGDITKIPVDAIVNAANSSLQGGGGVDGAIHRAGGPAILAACREIVARQGSCKTGDAVITPAGKLPAHFVIHTVGPVWHGGAVNEPAKLASCYRRSLELAVANRARRISFPNISTGVYGYPKAAAAEIAWQTVNDYLQQQPEIDEVIFVCFDKENLDLYQQLMQA